MYSISGNIGNIFNLAVWQSGSKLPNFYYQIYINLLTMLCPCCATAKFNFRQYYYYSLILCKSPNFMIANISRYAVCTNCTYTYVYMRTYVCVCLNIRMYIRMYVCVQSVTLMYPTLGLSNTGLIQHLVYPTPGLSNTWFIQHLVYPAPGLSNTWFIQHLVYPTPGLSSTWFIQHLVYPAPGLSNTWFI